MRKILEAILLSMIIPSMVFANTTPDPDQAHKSTSSEAEFVMSPGETMNFIAVHEGSHEQQQSSVDESIRIGAIAGNAAFIAMVREKKLGGSSKIDNCPSPAPTAAPESVKSVVPTPNLGPECFEQREKAPESVYEVQKYDVATSYIAADQEACECLDKSIPGEVAKSSNDEIDEDELVMQQLLANVKEKQQRLQSINEGMFIQSILITKTSKGGKKLGARYVAPPETMKILDDARKELIKEATSKLKKKNPKKLKRIKEIAALIKPPSNDNLRPPSSRVVAPSCISMRDYMAFEQIPKEPAFYTDLMSMKEFKKTDWDMAGLKADYDRAYEVFDAEKSDPKRRQELEQKVLSLKARIIFLKKNPLISNLFASAAPEAMKEHLFNLIQKGYRPGVTAGEYSEYEKDLRSFFNSDRVNVFAREALSENLESEFKDSAALLDPRLPTTQPALENKFQLMSGASVKQCHPKEDRINLEVCTNNYLKYCKLVGQVAEEIQSGGKSLARPSDNLDQETQFDFNTDPSKNLGFQKLSEALCHTKRVSKSDPSKEMTFGQFKNDYCKVSGKKECEKGNNDLLVRKYLLEFQVPEGEGVNVAAAKAHDMTFLSVIRQEPELEYNEEDIREIKKASRPYSEMKKTYNTLAENGAKAVSPAEAPTPAKATHAPLDDKGAAAALPAAPVGPVAAAKAADEKKSSEVAKEVEEIKRDIKGTKEELAEVKGKKGKDSKSKTSELEEKLQKLEKLLADRNKDYEQLLKREKEKDADASVADASKKQSQVPDQDEDSAGSGSTFKASAATTGGAEGFASRLPSGTLDAGQKGPVGSGTTGGAGGTGGASSGAAKVSASTGSINGALLEKHGIIVSEASADGKILLGQAQDQESLTKLAGKEGTSVPVVVSEKVFEQVKGNDLGSLKAIYEQKIKDASSAVVKLSISVKGKEDTLEFYAVREGGKLVFQPVRKHEASMLRKLVAPPTT